MEILNYIGGELVKPMDGKFFDNFNPSTGKVYSQIPDSDEKDIALAVQAASEAFPIWSGMRMEERSNWLLKLADAIDSKKELLAQAESKDNGKPLWLASSVDIPRASSNFRFYATALLHFNSEFHDTDGFALNYTLRKPLGVVGCISPWNLPLYLFSWKIAPALAMGNTVVAKPSEITPFTAFMLSQICIEIGFPKGVLNIVHGYGNKAGEAIVRHQDTKAISFTGGTKTGAHIAGIAGPMFKKTSLELGGKNPNIIFQDCHWENMLKTTLKSSFANQGQICLCGSRILIQESIYEQFKTDFVKRVKALTVGNPEEKVDLGAVVSKEHMEKVLSYIELAKKEGATLLCGGERVQFDNDLKDGWYLQPTVLEGVNNQCRVNQEEIFGPVISLIPFNDEEQAIAIANDTPYGLSSTIWTENLGRAHRVAAKLHVGITWINCWLLRDLRTPFGGVKSSGVGREGGFEALRFFSEPHNVCIKI